MNDAAGGLLDAMPLPCCSQPHTLKDPQMLLRDKIRAAIAAAQGDLDAAAMNVSVLLSEEVELSASGWFDDDEQLAAEVAARDAQLETEIARADSSLKS